MINKVIFVSRWCAEATGPWPDWAMISIGEPDAPEGKVQLKTGWHSVLSLSFHDVDPKIHQDDTEYLFMTEEDARQIIQFVREAAPKVDGIVIHCRAGISRSAAVAKWIAGEFSIPFDSGYKRYNLYVYELLIKVGEGLSG